jgi:hypothetical protein
MNRSTDPTRGERLGLIVAFFGAVVVVAAGLFSILQKGAPITAPSKQAFTENLKPAPVINEPPPSVGEIIDSKKATTAYRCLVNGTVTYSDSACPGGKSVDVTPAAEGYLAQRTLPAARKASPEPTVAAISQDPTAANEQPRRAVRCAWILAEIERLDVLARQPLAASTQDWLRETRRKLVDERYERKC